MPPKQPLVLLLDHLNLFLPTLRSVSQLTLTTSMDFIQVTLFYANGSVYNGTSYGLTTGANDVTSEMATYVLLVRVHWSVQIVIHMG